MDRYIDADALYVNIKAECNPYGDPTINFDDGCKVLDMIRCTPTAVVAPVIHAHWVDTWGHSLFECSACGNEFDDRLLLLDHQNDFPNYCPSCGAKMDEEVE